MRLLFISTICLLLSLSTLAEITDADFQGREDIEDVLKKVEHVDNLQERIILISGHFLGRPFAGDALGEGAQAEVDRDPIVRTDKFDCMTYVETVLAAALSKDWESFKKHIVDIRYINGEVSFATRNHFVETDWLKNNENHLKNITASVFGDDSLSDAATTIKKAAWFKRTAKNRVNRPDLADKPGEVQKIADNLVHDTSHLEDRPAAMRFLPFTKIIKLTKTDIEKRIADEAPKRALDPKLPELQAKKEAAARMVEFRATWLQMNQEKIDPVILAKIPSGSIVNYVHPNRPLEGDISTNMLVTHQGFLIRGTDGVLYQRHAAIGRKVMDIPFLDYANLFVILGPKDPRGLHLSELR